MITSTIMGYAMYRLGLWAYDLKSQAVALGLLVGIGAYVAGIADGVW